MARMDCGCDQEWSRGEAADRLRLNLCQALPVAQDLIVRDGGDPQVLVSGQAA